MRRVTYIILLFSALMSCSAAGPARQQEEQEEVFSYDYRDLGDSLLLARYDFLDIATDTLIDPAGTMINAYRKLQTIERLGPDSVAQCFTIVHYGDSHIQAGTLTETARVRFQKRFGNAGRGMIIPHRLTRSNEPRDYRVKSPNTWEYVRIIQPEATGNVGAGGLGIRSREETQIFMIQTLATEDSLDYRFNRVVVFHDSLAPMITVAESMLADIGDADTVYNFLTELDLSVATDSAILYTYKEPPFTDGAFYGFSLENGNSGVLYHSLGINGACFLHWGRSPEIIQQSRAMGPDLIIVSLGSNEAAGRNFIESVFYDQIDSFVGALRRANPGSAILLTTPPEAMRRARRSASPNRNFERVRQTILDYAADNSMAVFDLYAITGGENSSRIWEKENMLTRDKIHYTPEGYTLQGVLLYQAFMNGFRNYANPPAAPGATGDEAAATDTLTSE